MSYHVVNGRHGLFSIDSKPGRSLDAVLVALHEGLLREYRNIHSVLPPFIDCTPELHLRHAIEAQSLTVVCQTKYFVSFQVLST